MRQIAFVAVLSVLIVAPMVAVCLFVPQLMPPAATADVPTTKDFRQSIADIKTRQQCVAVMGTPTLASAFRHREGHIASERWLYAQAAREDGRVVDAVFWIDPATDAVYKIEFYDPFSGEVLR